MHVESEKVKCQEPETNREMAPSKNSVYLLTFFISNYSILDFQWHDYF